MITARISQAYRQRNRFVLTGRNEITAIPSLLDEIDIEDAAVSIDAIGCQRSIAQQITGRK
jgi:predicted transposase YbfD/YdcC